MLLSINNLRKTIISANGPLRVIFDRVNFSLARGEIAALVGRSGAGKTTLLHLVAGLDHADRGQIIFDGDDLTKIKEKDCARLRRRKLGLVFQNNLALSALPVWENAALPLLLEGERKKVAREKADILLDRIGLAGYAKAPTAALSGGQRRRLGLARALIANPVLMLADEPTSDLDDATAAEIERLLFGWLAETRASAIIVTHAASIQRAAHRVLHLENGHLTESR